MMRVSTVPASQLQRRGFVVPREQFRLPPLEDAYCRRVRDDGIFSANIENFDSVTGKDECEPIPEVQFQLH